jgi:Zn-dependent peptidase ImmA (M78 family)
MIPNWTWTSPKPLDLGRSYDPFAHAEDLGINVILRPIRTANELWLPDYATIVVKSTMRPVWKRSSCAHGVAHALLAHQDDRAKFEIQADRLAGENMIPYDEIAEMVQWSPECHILANEFGVTTRIMRIYLQTHRFAA